MIIAAPAASVDFSKTGGGLIAIIADEVHCKRSLVFHMLWLIVYARVIDVVCV